MGYKETLVWGAVQEGGSEMWDSNPVFLGDRVAAKDWMKLVFYPKKYVLYREIMKARKRHLAHERKVSLPVAEEHKKSVARRFRVLDAGCGTGATVIDFKKMFGRSVDVVGVDVVAIQIDVARKKMLSHGVWADVLCYDGMRLPFPDNSFDAVYTSDVLGHVANVRGWVGELARVLRPGGTLAMFAESKLGRHAWIRRHLFLRGLNVDPHAAFHISLYEKETIREFLEAAGFGMCRMYGILWAAFFVHPDEFYNALRSAAPRFPILRMVNAALFAIKKRLHPYSTAAGELYGLLEMLTVGRWVESQGYIVLAKKK